MSTTTANAGSLDGARVASNTGNDSKTTRRWIFGRGRQYDIGNSDFPSSHWKEIIENDDRQNSDNDTEGSILQRQNLKNRLGLLYFGRIDLLSAFERSNSNTHSLNKSDNIVEHPVRTNLWEMNLEWSFLSPNSKMKERAVKIELHPEGYCRIIGNNDRKNLKEGDCINLSVLGLGRWRKRPWGVTIVIRPLFIPKSSLEPTKFDDDGDGRQENKACSKENKEIAVVDEGTEFIFHAKNFHWNGFGSNPKLTQGTILLQKQRNNNHNTHWWRSTTWSSSSILSLWPEELSGNDGEEDRVVASGSGSWGSVHSELLGFLGNLNFHRSERKSASTHKRWFRPVVGTFIAKGIL